MKATVGLPRNAAPTAGAPGTLDPRFKRALTRAGALGAVLVAWTIVAYGNLRIELMPRAILPTPGAVLAVAVEMIGDGSLGRHLVTSLLRVVQGFGLAAAAALSLGILAGICLPLRHLLRPRHRVRAPHPAARLPPHVPRLVWPGRDPKVAFIGNRSYIPGKEGQVDWLLLHSGVVASGKMLKENPNTVKAVLRGLKKATATINTNRDAAAKAVSTQMKIEEPLTREIMALNIYSMEMNDKI